MKMKMILGYLSRKIYHFENLVANHENGGGICNTNNENAIAIATLPAFNHVCSNRYKTENK